MGDQYKSCELHGKPFPQNMIDTEKTDIARLYVERKEEIEGETVNLSLFVSAKSENEGFDICSPHLQERVLDLLVGEGITPLWRIVKWNPVTKTKKDGSTYERNEKTVYSVEEYREVLKAQKKAQK